jgi:hypothetical protein
MATNPSILPFLRSILPSISSVEQHMTMSAFLKLADCDDANGDAWARFTKLYNEYVKTTAPCDPDMAVRLWASFTNCLHRMYFDPKNRWFALYEPTAQI